ncbi:MAG TPA: hypothetical protein VFZ64_17770 [Nocardioidaceae bacterium]
MTRLLAKVMMWLALMAVVVVAGGHTMYYLMSWEWNRASIAGVATLGGLMLASTLLVLGRLSRVETKLDLLLAGQAAQTGARPLATRADVTAAEVQLEPRPDFPWLSQSPALALGLLAVAPRETPDAAVFIPVFLAAGLIISALAGGVERIAALVQGRRAQGVPTPATRASELRSTRETLRAQPTWLLVLVPLVGALMIGGTIGGLYWASHYWSKPIGPGVTTMTVEVDARGPTTSDIDVVETVGRYCTIDTGTGITFAGVEPGPSAEITLLRVEPLLDEDAQTRYIGCLEDAAVEWHRLTVTGTELAPSS